MISYMIWVHIWKFYIWNHDFIYYLISHMKISYMKSWFHICSDFTYKNSIYELHNFTYEQISHMKISYMKSWFHIWSEFTYENFIYEIMISYIIWFHIWKFHIWNHDFIYDLVSHMNISNMKSWFHIFFGFTYENFIYELISSYMKWSFHILWNYMWNFRKGLKLSSHKGRWGYSWKGQQQCSTFQLDSTLTLTFFKVNELKIVWDITKQPYYWHPIIELIFWLKASYLV